MAEALMGLAFRPWRALVQDPRTKSSERRSSCGAFRMAAPVGEVYVALGIAALRRGDAESARKNFEDADAIATEAQDAWGKAWALENLMGIAVDNDDLRKAEAIASERWTSRADRATRCSWICPHSSRQRAHRGR